jgi:hypothetical protein
MNKQYLERERVTVQMILTDANASKKTRRSLQSMKKPSNTRIKIREMPPTFDYLEDLFFHTFNELENSSNV